MNPRRERGFQCWLAAVSLLAAGAAAAAEAPSLPALKVETEDTGQHSAQYHGVVELCG